MEERGSRKRIYGRLFALLTKGGEMGDQKETRFRVGWWSGLVVVVVVVVVGVGKAVERETKIGMPTHGQTARYGEGRIGRYINHAYGRT